MREEDDADRAAALLADHIDLTTDLLLACATRAAEENDPRDATA